MIGLPHAGYVSIAARGGRRLPPERSIAAAAWLFTVAFAVIMMVVVGGATRLTGSGLSITEWKPVYGALPPMSNGAWADLFRRYQAIPQYRVVNPDMTLAAFKSIFWWEWGHRLLGRLVGVLFAAPFVALVVFRRLPRRLIWPCVVLFALGGLQGLVGWWMVSSGLETLVYVAPERLAVHLGLALALMCALVWTGLEAGWGPRAMPRARPGRWPLASALFLVVVFLQCLMGALVAGNHAGLANADWPLMAGRLVPADYWQGGAWGTIAHGVAAVQFNHRILAYGLAAFALALSVAATVSRTVAPIMKLLTATILLGVFVQMTLGVALLWGGVPTTLALFHQLTASLLLASATMLAWAARPGIIIPYHK